MQKRDMGVPLRANVDAEAQGMILRKTKVVGGPPVDEGETAGRRRVPGMRGNHVQRGLQLCGRSRLLFGLPGFIDVDRHAVPMDDAALLIAQRLTTGMVPTKFAVR